MAKHELIDMKTFRCNVFLEILPLNKSYYCPYCNVHIYEEIRIEINNLIFKKRLKLGWKKNKTFIIEQTFLTDYKK